MHRKKVGICGYCGEPGGTADHVFAKKLLLPASHALTISCCQRCNESKAESDLYLRDFLGIRPEIQGMTHLSFLRAAARQSALKPNKTRPARAMLRTWRNIYGPTPTGAWGVIAGSVTVDGDRLKEAFHWILKGIWFNHHKSVLTISDLTVGGFEGTDNLKALRSRWPDFDEASALGVGNSVRYRITACATTPPSGTCLIWMYGALLFQIHYNEDVLIRAATERRA